MLKLMCAYIEVEIHPAYPQNELLEYCNSKKIILTAYSPLGQYNSPFFRDAILQEVAMTEKATVAQVSVGEDNIYTS